MSSNVNLKLGDYECKYANNYDDGSKVVNDFSSNLFTIKLKLCRPSLLEFQGGAENGKFCILNQQSIFDCNQHVKSKSPFCLSQIYTNAYESLSINTSIILKINNIFVGGFTIDDMIRLMLRMGKDAKSENSDAFEKLSIYDEDLITLSLLKYSESEQIFPQNLDDFLRKKCETDKQIAAMQTALRENLYKRSVPVTTRPKRDHETENVDYIFISQKQFTQLQQDNLLIEFGCFNGNYYGTPRPNLHIYTSSDNNQPLNNTIFNEITLPAGWESVQDEEYGVYYVDHVRRKTQYENPLYDGFPNDVFTKDVEQLLGTHLETNLLKTDKGFGFRIVGVGEDDSAFIQIKSIVIGSPAHLDGVLQPGDILVYIKDVCVLGYSQHSVIDLFKSVGVNEQVRFRICRGYRMHRIESEISKVQNTINNQTDVSNEYYCLNSSNQNANSLQGYQKPLPSMFGRRNSTDAIKSVNAPGSYSDYDNLTINSNSISNSTGVVSSNCKCFQYISMNMEKGKLGFGFTLTQSKHGLHIVEKIVDASRCLSLCKNDTIFIINNVDVTKMNHLEVVEYLRSLPVNEKFNFVVQRKNQKHFNGPLGDVYSTPQTHCNKPVNNTVKHQTLGGKNKLCHIDNLTDIGYIYNKDYCSTLPKQKIFPATNTKESQSTKTNDCISNYSRSIESPISVEADQSDYSKRHLVNSGFVNNIAKKLDIQFKAESVNRLNFPYLYIHVELTVGEIVPGFGFRIIGGSEENTSVSIGSIVPNSSAQQQHILNVGDVIVSVNEDIVDGESHATVVHLINESRKLGLVQLYIRRNFKNRFSAKSFIDNFQPSKSTYIDNNMRLQKNQYTVILKRDLTKDFGFGIVSSVCRDKYPQIGNFTRDFEKVQLSEGDKILTIQGICTKKFYHAELIDIILKTPKILRLTLEKTSDDDVYKPAKEILKIQDNSSSSNNHSSHTSNMSTYTIDSEKEFAKINDRKHHLKKPSLPRIMKEAKSKLINIELKRGKHKGFGFSIRGGCEFENMPIHVLNIAKNGIADIDGRLKVNDHIVQIEGQYTDKIYHDEALSIINNCQTKIHIITRQNIH